MKPYPKCKNCDRFAYGVTGLCRACFDIRRAERAPKCVDCGVQVRSRSCKRCPDCAAKERAIRNTLPSHGGVCVVCGGACSITSMSGVCKTCASRAAAARWAELRGEPPRDYAIEDAAKMKRIPVVKRCNGCGGKYQTKECLTCLVRARR